jgi:hypothetical protein
VTASVSPQVARPGEPILVTLTNNSAETITLPSSCTFAAVFSGDACGGGAVFAPACLAVLTPLAPDETSSMSWDQLDQGGQQVPAGLYSFEIRYFDGAFNAQTCCTDVMISSSFCDASDGALASCPCLNPGSPDTGCDSPIPVQQGGGTTGGIRLDVVAQATAPQNAATVTGTGYPSASAPAAIALRAAALDPASPVVFGDGLRCVGVPIVRLGAASASGGLSTHTFGHGAAAGSGTFHYQLWFRSTPISYCDPVAAFNLSNGRTIAW